jgi:CRISPR-associated protein Csx10
VRDVLLASLRYVLADQQDKSACLPDVYCRFQGNCDLPLEAYEDHFYSGDQAGYYEAIRPKRRQITQTAIDPRRETASPANLFTVEAMEEGQTFAGYFTLGDSAAEKEFSETVCCQGSHLRLGYGRTRGLGLTEVEICKVEEPVPWRQTLPERLQAFNELAHQERCRVSVGQTLFALTLLADAVVLDPFFRPLTSLDGATLGREIHPALADAQLILAFADTRLVAGWSSPQGLPVAPDQAIAAGSVFVFTTTLSQTDLAALFTTTEVERRGIGERTIEGCGQVAVCHPFHQEVMPS